MNSINLLQNVVVDKTKIAELVKSTNSKDLKQLLGIKDSQASNIRRGERKPSADGLLRLLMAYNIKPEELATVAPSANI